MSDTRYKRVLLKLSGEAFSGKTSYGIDAPTIAKVARQISNILSDNDARAPIFGANSPLYVPGYQVAAKTGTTQNFVDGWTMGYSPFAVVGVWTGNNNNAPLKKEPGSVVAGPIFHSFMDRVLPKYGKEAFSATN